MALGASQKPVRGGLVPERARRRARSDPRQGLVIDLYLRVSRAGIELLTVDARVVVASVDTYLRFAEAVGRLDIDEGTQGLPQLFKSPPADVAKSTTRGAIDAATEKLSDVFGGDDEETA